jgi:protein-L-isoaspartate O-methyltransferase
LDRLALQGHESVLDLYAGWGSVFGPSSRSGPALVTVIESYPPAVTDADENLAEFEHIDLFEVWSRAGAGRLDRRAGRPYDAAAARPTALRAGAGV